MDEKAGRSPRAGKLRGCLGAGLFALVLPVVAVATLWAVGAIYFDGPAGREPGNVALAVGWLIATALLLIRFGRRAARFLLVWTPCFAVVLVPWLLIPASNDRDWKPEWARTGWVERDGDTLTFYNFRNFDYTAEGDVTERWETRTVLLSNLRGVDYFHDAFGGENWAHPMLSYDFGPDGRILLSIETRREVGESFSQFGGLFKMFELQYLFGDERDFVRVRANIRREPVYLYRMKAPPEEIRATFLDSVRVLNELKDKPKFYNVLTQNCTTSYWTQTPLDRWEQLDLRILVNGKLDELFYEQGSLVTDDLSFAQLREQALINPAAEAAHDAPDFAERIRWERPGFRAPNP